MKLAMALAESCTYHKGPVLNQYPKRIHKTQWSSITSCRLSKPTNTILPKQTNETALKTPSQTHPPPSSPQVFQDPSPNKQAPHHSFHKPAAATQETQSPPSPFLALMNLMSPLRPSDSPILKTAAQRHVVEGFPEESVERLWMGVCMFWIRSVAGVAVTEEAGTLGATHDTIAPNQRGWRTGRRGRLRLPSLLQGRPCCGLVLIWGCDIAGAGELW